jgi:hypothetical protein
LSKPNKGKLNQLSLVAYSYEHLIIQKSGVKTELVVHLISGEEGAAQQGAVP